MITGELKNRINSLWEIFWTGGITNPLDVVEQMTYLMFIHDLDETDNLRAREAAMLGLAHQSIFTEEVRIGERTVPGNQLKWSVFHDFPAEKMYAVMQEQVFPFIKNLHGDKASAYAKYMDDAIFKIPTPLMLDKVITALDGIYEQMAQVRDGDVRGDVYEFLLSKIATAGVNGQFRTPRYIIKMMVELMAPGPDEVICDPACGTSGFLVAAGEYLKEHHKQEIFFDRRIVPVFHNLLPRHQEGLLRPRPALLRRQIMEPGHDVRNVAVRRRGALVVQAEPVGVHIVKPHLVRAAVAGLGKDQHPGGHPRVRLEHPGGHGDHRLQPVVVHQLPPDVPVGLGRAEQHPVRHDDSAAPAHLEHPQEQRQEQKLRLFRFAQLQQVGGHDVRVQTALEGRIGQDEGVLLPIRVLVGQAVPVLDEGVFHPMGHHVHGPDAQHGAVHIEAVEHVVHVVVLFPSINKYKKTEYVAVEYPPTSEIFAELRELEAEIQRGLEELEGMV